MTKQINNERIPELIRYFLESEAYGEHTIGGVVPAYNEENHVKDTIETQPDFVDKIDVVDDGSTAKNSKSGDLKTLVAIPCHNEEVAIGSIVLRAKKHADEVLVVDDGSADATSEIAMEAGATVLRHEKNKGYGAAIQTCFEFAKANGWDIMAIIDGDGQHDTNQIPSLIKPIKDNQAEIVIGSRFLDDNYKEQMPRYRKFGISILTKMTNLGFKKQKQIVSDAQSGFRAYSKAVIEKINPKNKDMAVSAEILLQAMQKKLKFKEVPISCKYNNLDTSTKNPFSHGIEVLVNIIRMISVERPMLWIGLPGFILIMAGLFFGIKLLQMYNHSGYFSIPMTLLGGFLIIIGTFAVFFGLLLNAIARVIDKMVQNNL